MEKISIFNYEAFYLDYLEGNLNEQDTAMFLAFLEEYPECKMDGDDMPLLSDEDAPSYKFKNNLKQVDSEERITLTNVDHFLIEASEGIITEEKQKELATFIQVNDLSYDEKLVGAVYFAPDKAEVYKDKAGLKQKETIVLWPYISTAAAACIIVLMLLWNNNPAGVVDPGGENIAEDGLNNSPIEQNDGVKNNAQIANEIQPEKLSTPINKTIPQQNQPAQSQDKSVDKIERSPMRPIITGLDDRQLASITKKTYVENANEPVKVQEQDYASLHFADMENPIEPITKLISKKTKTPLDFRRQKASKKKAGGFFVKIGKFELSHKKH